MVVGPAIQDLWLLLPGRAKDCPAELEAFLRGYELMRAFNHQELKLMKFLEHFE